MKTHDILHIIRNPWGKSEEEVRQARIDAADLIEQLERDIIHLIESREHESERLEWLLARISYDERNRLIGQMTDRNSVSEWREKIDDAITRTARSR